VYLGAKRRYINTLPFLFLFSSCKVAPFQAESGGDVVPLGQFDGISAVVDGHESRVVSQFWSVQEPHVASQRRVRHVRRRYRRSADEILLGVAA